VRNIKDLPPLTEPVIAGWAVAHFRRTGTWPTETTGEVTGATGESWKNIDAALRDAHRGLPGGSSLARLLRARLGVRNRGQLPPLTRTRILAWADAHRARTGRWPRHTSGAIPAAPGETWRAVETALRRGQRGLPGGSSLAQLLAHARGVRNKARLPALSRGQILAWADAHRARTGRWPTATSGPVVEAPGETWGAVAHALKEGLRGLPAGFSLARLLAAERGTPNRARRPCLRVGQIRAWAQAHRRGTGRWPTARSGPIPEAPGETWLAVESALREGRRGLPGGSSLARALGHGRRGGRGRVVRKDRG
jgi:hypothetical protein